MDRSTVARLQGVAYLVAGLLAVGLAALLLLDPGRLAEAHPLPLVVLLAITGAIGLSLAWQRLR